MADVEASWISTGESVWRRDESKQRFNYHGCIIEPDPTGEEPPTELWRCEHLHPNPVDAKECAQERME